MADEEQTEAPTPEEIPVEGEGAAQEEEAAEATAVESVVEEMEPDIMGFTDISVDIMAVLGTAYMPIEQFLKLGRGAIIELEQHKDQLIEVRVNNFPFAKAEIRVVDENIGFMVKDIIDHSRELH